MSSGATSSVGWITQTEATLLLDRLEQEAEFRRDPVDIPDPKADYLVALYRVADTEVPVTGDADFAGLTGELVVTTPAEMLARL